MNVVKVLIVEDEMIIANSIVKDILSFGYEVMEPAINYSEAIKAIENQCPDIAIFDIQLSGNKSGIDLANEVNEKYKFPFIYLTSNSDKETLSAAKKTNPSAFLVKPFNSEELYAAIEIAIYKYYSLQEEEFNRKILNNALFIKQKSGFEKLLYSDIRYIKSDNVYLDIFLKDGTRKVVRGTFRDYILLLPSNFIRTHRSYIVNIDLLKSIHNLEIVIDTIALPISKQMKEFVLNRLNHD
ncbi:MAG: response regulator [Saprospiraceae bacterium]